MVVRGSAWDAASWTSRSGTPASNCGDERVPQGVRSDLLGQPGASRDAADNPVGSVPVQPLPGWGDEDRPLAAFADGQVDRPGGARGERDDGFLAALSGNGQGLVTAFVAEGFDVGAGGLGHPQPVQREQGDQRVLGGGAEPGSDEQGSDFVAVQADGVGFIVGPRPADVGCRGMVEQVFLDRVPVQAGDGGQPAGDGGAGPSGSFEVAGEQLDVSTARREQAQLPLAAPGGELAQIQRVSLPGHA